MSLDAIYADDIDASLQRWAANPGPAPDPGFSLTSFLGAGLKGIPAAALEATGTAADAASGFGNIMAATGGSGGGMFALPTEAEKKQEAEARQRMLAGDNASVQIGNELRQKAEELAPDAVTAHRADQVIFGLTRFGGKAAAYVGAGGVPGAAVLGLEEGNTAAQNLRQKGIDTGTAVQAGAVQGVTSAAGAVIPLGGKTVLQTLGLVAAGGPGMFMAQEALSKNILQRAGYADEASLHNPFDPLGLVLSTVIPGAFGALHMRSLNAPKLQDVVRHIESGGNPNAVGPNIPGQGTAKGEMQVMDATNTDPGFGVTPAKDNSPEERARVGRDYLGAMVNRYGDQDKALAAYNAGPGAVDAAIKAHGDDWIAHMPEETQKYVAKARKLTGDYVASEGAKSPDVVDAARVSALNETMARSLPDDPEAFANVMRASDIVAERGGRAAEAATPPVHVTALPQFREWFGDSKVVDEQGQPRVMYHGTAQDINEFKPKQAGAIFVADHPIVGEAYGKQSAQWMAEHGQEGAPNIQPLYVKAERPFDYENQAHVDALVDQVFQTTKTHTQGDGQKALVLDGRDTLYTKPVLEHALKDGEWNLIERPEIQQAVKALGRDSFYVNEGGFKNLGVYDPKQVKSAIGNSGKFDPNSASLTDPLRPGERSPREANNALPPADSVSLAGDQPAKRGAEVGAQEQPEGAGAAGASAGTVDHGIAQKIAAESPDLKVTLPGSDEQMTVAEALKRIAEEHKQDGQWADLVKVAVECALGG